MSSKIIPTWLKQGLSFPKRAKGIPANGAFETEASMSQEGDLFGRYWVSGEDAREKKIEGGYRVMDHAGRCAQNDGLPQEGIGGHGPGKHGGAIEDHLGPGFTDSCQCNIVGVNRESSHRNN